MLEAQHCYYCPGQDLLSLTSWSEWRDLDGSYLDWCHHIDCPLWPWEMIKVNSCSLQSVSLDSDFLRTPSPEEWTSILVMDCSCNLSCWAFHSDLSLSAEVSLFLEVAPWDRTQNSHNLKWALQTFFFPQRERERDSENRGGGKGRRRQRKRNSSRLCAECRPPHRAQSPDPKSKVRGLTDWAHSGALAVWLFVVHPGS